jgi:hypothetical protein
MDAMSEARVIPNGTFTIQSPTGDHRTFKITKPKKNKPRWVMLLVGSDNERSYRSFALIGNDNRRIRVFQQFRGDGNYNKYARMLEVMLTTDRNRYTDKGATIAGSRKCARCGRKLTEPESLRAGIGPICRGM